MANPTKDQILQNAAALLNDHVVLLDKFGLKAASNMAGNVSQETLRGIAALKDDAEVAAIVVEAVAKSKLEATKAP